MLAPTLRGPCPTFSPAPKTSPPSSAGPRQAHAHPQALLSLCPSVHQPFPLPLPPAHLVPFPAQKPPDQGLEYRDPQDLEDDGTGSEWALGLEKAVGGRVAWGSLPASFPGQDRRPGWLLPSQFCAAGEAGRERLALLPTLLWEQGAGLHEPQGEPGEGPGPAWLERWAWERSSRSEGECPGGGCLQPGSPEGRQVRSSRTEGRALLSSLLGMGGWWSTQMGAELC